MSVKAHEALIEMIWASTPMLHNYIQRHYPLPGQFIASRPPEVRALLETLKSDDIANLRRDDLIVASCGPAR
jgi:hypothetical protein